MSAFELSGSSGRAYQPLPLTKLEKQKRIASFRNAPTIRRKANLMHEKEAQDAASLLAALPSLDAQPAFSESPPAPRKAPRKNRISL